MSFPHHMQVKLAFICKGCGQEFIKTTYRSFCFGLFSSGPENPFLAKAGIRPHEESSGSNDLGPYSCACPSCLNNPASREWVEKSNGVFELLQEYEKEKKATLEELAPTVALLVKGYTSTFDLRQLMELNVEIHDRMTSPDLPHPVKMQWRSVFREESPAFGKMLRAKALSSSQCQPFLKRYKEKIDRIKDEISALAQWDSMIACIPEFVSTDGSSLIPIPDYFPEPITLNFPPTFYRIGHYDTQEILEEVSFDHKDIMNKADFIANHEHELAAHFDQLIGMDRHLNQLYNRILKELRTLHEPDTLPQQHLTHADKGPS